MYIRRKVYSAVEDYDGEIRYFSTNEIISEEEYLEALYSEDYLDDEDMERLFSDDDEGLSKGAKIAIGAGAGTVAAAGALDATYHGAKALAKNYKQVDITNRMKAAKKELKKQLDEHVINQKQYDAAMKKLERSTKVQRKIGSIAKSTEEKLGFVGKAEAGVASGAKAAWGGIKKGASWTGDKAKKGAMWVGKEAKAGAKWVGKEVKAGAKWAKAHPAAATGIAVGTAAAGTGAVLGAKALKKRREEEE